VGGIINIIFALFVAYVISVIFKINKKVDAIDKKLDQLNPKKDHVIIDADQL